MSDQPTPTHKKINWRSRIVQTGTIRAADIIPHPQNPRYHPQAQREAVAASFDELGQIGRIIININNGYLVDGEERSWLALEQGDDTEVAVDWVDLTEEEHLKALAYYDATGLMATYDRERLDAITADLQSESSAINEMLEHLKEIALDPPDGSPEEDPFYTRKIDIPIYEPSNERPEMETLYDDSHTRHLIAQIDASDVSEAEKDFLRLAAYRHTVLNFARIADLYAHGSPALQRLMEDSALVMIDFDRALELGYAEFTKRVSKLIGEEMAEDDDEES